MGAAALPWIAGVGAAGSLLQGNQANKNARSALNAQQQQAQNQQGLFNQASPYYGQLLAALGGYAGLPGPGPQMMPGPLNSVDRIRQGLGRDPLSPPTMVPVPGQAQQGQGVPSFPGAQQLPYTNVTAAQLGPYANATDALRLRAAEDQSRVQTNQALHNFSFGQGQRGLFGSSIDAAGRAAIISDALRGQNQFSRDLAIQAPQEYAQRLGLLGNALNAGLQAGPIAAGIYGQGANMQFGQGQMFGQQAGSAISDYLKYHQMQGHGGADYAPTGIAGGKPTDTTGYSYYPMGGSGANGLQGFQDALAGSQS